MGLEGDSNAKWPKSPDFSSLRDVADSSIVALWAEGFAFRHSFLACSYVSCSMVIEVGLCMSLLGNLRGKGLVKALATFSYLCTLGGLKWSIVSIRPSEEVALVMPEAQDLDLNILLLKAIK